MCHFQCGGERNVYQESWYFVFKIGDLFTRHCAQGGADRREPESREFEQFYNPAFAGMTTRVGAESVSLICAVLPNTTHA